MNSTINIVLLFFGLFLFESCKNEPSHQIHSQEVKEQYGSGETSRIYYRVNGKIEGKMTDFYQNGSLKGERFFKNDLQTGKTTIFYKSGKIKEVQYYSNGLKNGGDTIFYESGPIQYVTDFIDDKKNGYLRKWEEDGELTYEAKFKMDTLVEVNGSKVDTKINNEK